jgi:hypothetical protein
MTHTGAIIVEYARVFHGEPSRMTVVYYLMLLLLRCPAENEVRR